MSATKEHKIGWLNLPGYIPETWNPIIGCSEKSEGCKNCFAKRMAHRLMHMPFTDYYQFVLANNGADDPEEFRNLPEWNGTTHLVKSALDKPAKWKKPRMIFTVDMGDLFHESTPFEWIDAVFSVMSDNDQHIYVLLTKRPERVLEFFCWKILQSGFNWRPKDNVWIGATVEDQEQANIRIPHLLKIPASVRFVSIEPMLGPIDFYEVIFKHEYYHALKGFGDISGGDFKKFGGPKLDWVICGGETGPKARPMNQNWAIEIKNQCNEANVPFFFKQWGEWEPRNVGSFAVTNDPKSEKYELRKVPYSDNPFEFSNVSKVGRKNSGNLLDGQQHHEWPKINL